MAVTGTITKQSWDEWNTSVDFSDALSESETIVSATVTVTPKGATTDLTATMAGTPSISDGVVICLIKGGTTGNTYNVSYRAVTSGSQKFEADLALKVLDVT